MAFERLDLDQIAGLEVEQLGYALVDGETGGNVDGLERAVDHAHEITIRRHALQSELAALPKSISCAIEDIVLAPMLMMLSGPVLYLRYVPTTA